LRLAALRPSVRKFFAPFRFSLTRNSGEPTKWSASTPKAIPGISAGQDLQRIRITPEETKQEARKAIWKD